MYSIQRKRYPWPLWKLQHWLWLRGLVRWYDSPKSVTKSS